MTESAESKTETFKNPTMAQHTALIYKMSWYTNRRSKKSNEDMYFLQEEHTRWGLNWPKGWNGSDICKIKLIQVSKDSKEYDSAVTNSKIAESLPPLSLPPAKKKTIYAHK